MLLCDLSADWGCSYEWWVNDSHERVIIESINRLHARGGEGDKASERLSESPTACGQEKYLCEKQHYHIISFNMRVWEGSNLHVLPHTSRNILLPIILLARLRFDCSCPVYWLISRWQFTSCTNTGIYNHRNYFYNTSRKREKEKERRDERMKINSREGDWLI